MTIETPSAADTNAPAPRLELAACQRCGALSFPVNAWGCRACGADATLLRRQACTAPIALLNFVTVHADLVPGVPPPCVIGEVELAPGLVEEAVIDVADETLLTLGMGLEPVAELDAHGAWLRWRFRPLSPGSTVAAGARP